MAYSPDRRGRSYSPRPRARSPAGRGGGGGGQTSLMVRNLPKSIRPDDLRYYADKYGEVKDVYLPKDFRTGEPRGLGFIEFTSERACMDALRGLDRMILGGREIACNVAREGRKRPDDFRHVNYGGGGRPRGYGGGGGYGRGGYGRRYDDSDRRGGSDRYDRDADRDRDSYRRRDRDEYRPKSRSRSRSRSRDRGDSRSPSRSYSKERGRSPTRSPERSPVKRTPEKDE